MGLVRIGPVAIDVDDIRAIYEVQTETSRKIVVTFRDGSKMEFEAEAAEALRAFMQKLPTLPDGFPYGPNDATTGVVGRREHLTPAESQQG